MARVYVSSTRTDLHDHRLAVNATLRRLGHEDVAMEYYLAEGRPPIEKCLEDVASCDLYVGLIAWRYGSIPVGHECSYTELELRKAIDVGIETLVFVLSEDTSWPPKLVDSNRSRVEAIRQFVTDHLLVSPFSDVNDLRATVGEAVGRWEQRRGIRTHAERTDWDGYLQAVATAVEYVQLSVIAGTRQDRVAQIPLTDVFVAPMVEAGTPSYDLPDDVLEAKREFIGRNAPLGDDLASEIAEDVVDEQAPLEVIRTERVLDVLCRERTQVFLGGPGSGKSTLLHYALLALCTPRPAGQWTLPNVPDEAPVPFLIELRQYSLDRATDFVSYIVSNAQSRYSVDIDRDELKTLLTTTGRAVVFFDGLDEIFGTEERARVIDQFVSFARSFPGASIVVTSRIVGSDDRDIGVAGFEHYTILNFELPEIREFVPRWYRYYTWQGDERDAPGLLQRIADSLRLQDLAGNPLLLTMMAVIYKHQDLPEQRWQLYERCTSVLLEDWDFKRKRIESTVLQPVNLPIRQPQKAEILPQVSMFMLQQGQVGKELNAIAYRPLMTILADYLERKYDRSRGEAEAIAEGVLQHLRERSSILAEIGEGIYGFVHRTFMEYFAAVSCLAEFNAREADYPWITQEVFGFHWEEDHWREVLLLLVGMLADQKSPISKVVDHIRTNCKSQPPHNVVFAARCLAETGKVEDPALAVALLSELVNAIAKEVQRTKRREWPSGKDESALLVSEGLTTFAALCPFVEVPETARETIVKLNLSATRRVRVVGWQMELSVRSREERLDFALAALHDRDEAVRRGALAALGREWPRNSKVGDALVEIVRSDRNTRVVQDALEVLRRSWPTQPDLLTAIRARLPAEQAYSFVEWLIIYVAEGWAPSAEALDLVLALAATKPKAPDNYNYDVVVATAARRVAGQWQEDAVAAKALRERSTDPDAVVRQVALLALGAGWAGSDTFEFLRTIVVEASHDLPMRLAATTALALGLHRDAERLSLFTTLAADRNVALPLRQVAIIAMGDAGRDPDGNWDTLRGLSTTDTMSEIRLAALWALTSATPPIHVDVDGFYGGQLLPGAEFPGAELPQSTPELIALLRERAVEDDAAEVRAAGVIGLRQIDSEEALAVLRDLFRHDRDPEIRFLVLSSLLGMPVDLARDAVRSEPWDVEHDVFELARMFYWFPFVADEPLMQDALGDADPHVAVSQNW